MPPRKARKATSSTKNNKRASEQNDAWETARSASGSLNPGQTSTAKHVKAGHRVRQPSASNSASSSNSDELGEVSGPPRTRAIPQQVLNGRYCLFCFEQDGSKRHHSVPTNVEIQMLETELLTLQRKLHNSTPGDPSQSERPNENLGSIQHHNERYSVLLWQLERGKELRKKGFGPSFDLWIDHLTLSEMINDGWSYDAVRSRIPEDWIEDVEAPLFLAEKRSRFPPATEQKGDIAAEVAALDEEDMLDAMDDNEQQAEADMHRIRNISPVQALESDADDQPIGENLGLDAAHAAIGRLRRKLIPQTIRMWKDNAKPLNDGDSKLQMKDYLAAIHNITEPGAETNPSMETYRAIANIAFSMDAANRLWKKQGITDEGYSRLTRDGFKQLATLRDSLDSAGVRGLPPLSDRPPTTAPRQQKPLEPFVIHRWMDAKDHDLHRPYAYDPNRPLGPMISENAHTSGRDKSNPSANISYDKQGMVNLGQHIGQSSNVKMSREEIMGLNMELDQLVEDA